MIHRRKRSTNICERMVFQRSVGKDKKEIDGEEAYRQCQALLEVDGHDLKRKKGMTFQTDSNSTKCGQTIVLRRLAQVVLALWLGGFGLLASNYVSGMNLKKLHLEEESTNGKDPLITRWKLPENSARLQEEVRLRAIFTSRPVGYIQPGQVVEAHEYTQWPKHLLINSPIQGFVAKERMERLPDDDIDPSPLMYLGYRMKGKNITNRHTLAPTTMVVAQQLWNGLVVIHLLLAVCLYYQNIYASASFGRSSQFMIGALLTITHIVLLPFSIFVSSPGAMLFSAIILPTAFAGLKSERDLLLEVGSWKTKREDPQAKEETRPLLLDDKNSERSAADPEMGNDITSYSVSRIKKPWNPIWTMVEKDLVGFLCITCSWLYNYNSERDSIPYLLHHITKVDKHFGWTSSENLEYMEVFWEQLYTLGLPGVRVPMYIPRLRGSAFGCHMFIFLWSVIPFLYVSYFVCMYVSAQKSPGVLIQRGILLFGIFHFLFLTDCVDYRYGRGYFTPHAELVHWFERFAWRIAIVMPVYQSCTNGNWKFGHVNRWCGCLFHYLVGLWGFCFFLGVCGNDCFRFYRFLTGQKMMTLLNYWGYKSPGWPNFKPISYHGALFIFFILYQILLVGGFTPIFMYLKFADAPASAPSRKQQYQQPGSLRGVQLRRAMLVVLAIAIVGSVFIAQAVDLIMAYNSAEVPDGDEPSQSAESADD